VVSVTPAAAMHYAIIRWRTRVLLGVTLSPHKLRYASAAEARPRLRLVNRGG
jgi:hypothetical protein